MNTALRFSRIEPEQQPHLVQEICNILTEVGAHNVEIYDQAYWDWQYKQLPTGKSYVYAVWDADRIIGYYHIPVYRCVIDGEQKLIGNIQDVAVNPNYRGAGLFRKLAEYANTDIDTTDVDLIYTFPNDKSIHTFLKYNRFGTVGAVPTYLRPVNSGKIIRSKINMFGMEKLVGFFADAAIDLVSRNMKMPHAQIERITEITSEVETVFEEYSRSFRNHLVRDSAWLNWRYLQSVRGTHHLLGIRQAGQLTAVLVVKEDEMLGNPALLIMDFAFVSGKKDMLLFLIDQVRKQPDLTGAQFNLMFISAVAPILPDLSRIGFYKIPNKVNPRVLNLLARSVGKLDEKPLLVESNWLLTLGDWDVF